MTEIVEKSIIKQTEGYLQEVIKQYPTNRDAIAELEAKYMKLKINGLDDKEGYIVVHKARMDMRDRRIAIDKAYKDFNAEAQIFTNGIRTEKNELKKLCEPIETFLLKMEKTIDDGKLHIKNEAIRKEKERIDIRVFRLFQAGMIFNGMGYVFQSMVGFIEGENAGESVAISPDNVKDFKDEDFQSIIDKVISLKEEDVKRKAEADRIKKEEEARLEKIRLEKEAEEKRLREEQERIGKEQAKKEAELKAEADRIEAEKEKIEQDKQDTINKSNLETELKRAEQLAIEKALMEKKKAEEIAAAVKAEKERVAKIEAELAEKMKPDNEKLESFAEVILNLQIPELAYPTSFDVLKKAQGHLNRAVQILRQVQ